MGVGHVDKEPMKAIPNRLLAKAINGGTIQRTELIELFSKLHSEAQAWRQELETRKSNTSRDLAFIMLEIEDAYLYAVELFENGV